LDSNLNLALQRAASGVFEELTFMLPTHDLDEHPQNELFQMASAVEFRGPLSGKLVVAIYGNLIQTLAANMLGDMEYPSESQQRDALKEMTNVICGNLVPYFVGAEAVYRFDAPTILEETRSPEDSQTEPSAQLQIDMDQGRAELKLFLSGSSNAAERQI
jgi:CheY-specific phosphatase CheX